jgi:hypothetical protein
MHVVLKYNIQCTPRVNGGCVLHDHLMTTRIFSLRMDKMLYEHQKYEDIGYGHDFGSGNHVTLIVCFICYKKWVQR